MNDFAVQTHKIIPVLGTVPGSTNPLDISEECQTCHAKDGSKGPCRLDKGTLTVQDLVPGTLVHARPAPSPGYIPTGTGIVARPHGSALDHRDERMTAHDRSAVTTLIWFFPLGNGHGTVHAMFPREITPLRTTLHDLTPEVFDRLARTVGLLRPTATLMRPLFWTLNAIRMGDTSETRRCVHCLTATPADRAECRGCDRIC
ncbi:DUF6409 family protein [Streptomyces nanshensis]|uniref:Uncharacterized protein n=1 Tax=Streptomyces nanshensis TaxID=518642 RepID=A0A1E7LAF7_9ACTN|nr:DUF6409 family protein [Streptomyces nanshensis]OEV13225.1 hypothetical protein AN218_04565 [Streptomyces nanshensis]